MSDEQVVAAGVEGAVAEEVQVNPEVSTPAGETGEEQEPQGTQEQGEVEHEDKPKREGGFQRKIRRLEQESEYWRQQALRTQTPEPKPAEPAAEKEPDQNDFETLGEYLKAVRDYDRKAIARELKQEIAAEKQKEVVKTEEQKARESWMSKVETARSEYEDFDDVVFDDSLPITEPMQKALLKDEQGARIAYYLGTHREESARIAQLDPVGAAFALGEIKARIAGNKPAQEPAPKPPAPVTQAPPPPTPVKKTSPVTAAIKDPIEAAMKGDFAAYEKLMIERERKQREGR
jgi:hypothetical protein